MSLACFDTLVGLSSAEYACFSDAVPDDFDTSDSGYFLTDTDYGLTVIEQCSLAGWALLESALAQSILETKTDLRAALRTRYDGYIKPFSGLIGQLKSNATLTVSDTYIGLRIRVKQQKGVKLVLKKAYLGLNTSGTYAISVTSNDPLYVAPANTSATVTANVWSGTVLASITLPFWSDSCPYDYLEYYVSIPRGAALPVNNSLKCCGNTPGWMKHADVSGFGAATATPSESGTFSSNAYGMALDAYLICEELDWLCELEELNGYHLRDVLARTIQFRGAAIAISALLDTLAISPCTGYNFENLNAKRNYLNKRAADNIAWIAENVPSGVTDCFACKPHKIFSKSKQIV